MPLSPPLYERGAYRIALAEPASDATPLYLVLDSAGARLLQTGSLDEARCWLDERVEAAQRAAPKAVAAFLHRR